MDSDRNSPAGAEPDPAAAGAADPAAPADLDSADPSAPGDPGGTPPTASGASDAGDGREVADAAEASGAPATQDEVGPDKDDGSPRRPPRARSRAESARRSALFRALRARRPVSGVVEKVIKGGYEIRVGKSRGFCPHSQMDLHRVEDPEAHVGRTYPFEIKQLRRGGDDVVLSRRALLEEEQVENAKAVRATVVPGALRQGRVAGVAEFGAFVDLGAGVKGLVHISELAHGRVDAVEQAVQVGDLVQVRVLSVDDERGRISLSIRQAEPDPWDEVAQRYRAGEVHRGTVRRITDFGAFVELAPEVEGLAAAGDFPPSRLGWRKGLEEGVEGAWLALAVEPAKRRIALAPVPEGFDPAAGPPLEVGSKLAGKVQRVERFGVLVWLAPGRSGVMPNALTGAPRGTDLARSFLPGDDLEVEVVEADEAGRRIRLAKPGVAAARALEEREARPPREGGPRRREREEPAAPREVPSGESGNFGSTFADKLKAALNRPS